MKYFMIQEAPESKYAPKLENWYNEIDIRDIGLKTYPELPKMKLFTVAPSAKIIFTDIILFPFLLVSPSVMDVIQMYKELCFYREVILLDQGENESRLYYLPVFNETDKLRIVDKQDKRLEDSEFCLRNEKIYLNNHIFWVNNSKKRHTIISLDLAESLIKRNVTGLGIKEVELFMEREGQ